MPKKSRPAAGERSTPPRVLERRDHIIATTREMIGELGIEGITMRDLARRSGVVVGTLYNQFNSREAIIADALRQDFEGRYKPFPSTMPPSERLEARITEASKAIAGPMRDYTRSVMFFYFHYNPNADLRSTIHDFVMEDISRIVQTIEDRAELQPWVNARAFADDIVTQLYALAAKWTQGYIPERQLKARLIQAAASSFIGISLGATRTEFEALALRHSTAKHTRAG